MKFEVTTLGGARRSLQRVVAAIVEYLIPQHDPVPVVEDDDSAVVRYYADRGTVPGRWLGAGAAGLDLDGTVDASDFALVLAGRHPLTGTRLITAQGSAGRRPQLGVGAYTGWDASREALYDMRDAAAVLEVDVDDVELMVRTGARLATEQLSHALAQGFPPADIAAQPADQPGTTRRTGGKRGGQPGTTGRPARGSYLVPIVDGNGGLWVTETELARCEEARAIGVEADTITASGDPDDVLSIGDAAALVGVTPRYLRRVALYYERNRSLIDELLANGHRPRRDYIKAHRGKRDRWVLTRRELAAFVRRRDPPKVVAGYDVTLTTEKSLSVLALLAEPRIGQQVLGTIQDANDLAIDWLEAHSASARVQGRRVPVKGWTVASFRHLTSRALDPFTHWHNVVANTVQLTDGSRRALNAYDLHRDAHAASALATAEVRWRLTNVLGVRWRPSRHGGWEVAGISDKLLSDFSQRRNEVDDAVRELAEALGRDIRPDEIDKVVLDTRPAKQLADVDELHDRWWQRAEALGFHRHDLAICIGHEPPPQEIDTEWIYQRLTAPDGICHNVSIFSHGDVLAALCDLPIPQPDGADPQPLLVSAAQLEGLARGFLASRHVKQLTPGDRPRYTTREMLALQERLVARYTSGLRRGAVTVSPDLLAHVLADHPKLTGEQRHLVRHFCTSGHRIQCAIGYPGTGKTTTMAAARDVWEQAGFRVVGAAVKGEAARGLGDATGMPTETLAWWLAHNDPHTVPLEARTILIVDEASTVSDRDLDRLGWLCEQTGATLRLIGDPDQHGAVEAGGMFRVICQHHPDHTPTLTQTHRVRDPHDRAAATALRSGRIDEAFGHLAAAGHLHIVDDEIDFYHQILDRWWAAYQGGQHHPMVDGRNIVRRRLNHLAHELLKAAGLVGHDEIVATDDRHFSVSDHVIARTPARHLHPDGQPDRYVRNGSTGVIVSIQHAEMASPDDHTITVDFDGLGTITLPRTFFDEHPHDDDHHDVGLDHAYAITSYAVQGSTRPLSTSRIDERASRAELLVDITRGQTANHVYLTRSSDALDGEHLPRLLSGRIDQAVADKLTRSDGEKTAWELVHQKPLYVSAKQPRADAIGL